MNTPLNVALFDFDEDLAEQLLENGANPNEVGLDGKNALHVAVSNVTDLALFERILDRIDDINAVDHRGNTALILASYRGYVELVERMMDIVGINVNIQQQFGWTALHTAVRRNRVSTVRQLLRSDNINTDIRDIWGRKPSYYAGGNPEITRILYEYGRDYAKTPGRVSMSGSLKNILRF